MILIRYQIILHKNLMEMAQYVDNMFGIPHYDVGGGVAAVSPEQPANPFELLFQSYSLFLCRCLMHHDLGHMDKEILSAEDWIRL